MTVLIGLLLLFGGWVHGSPTSSITYLPTISGGYSFVYGDKLLVSGYAGCLYSLALSTDTTDPPANPLDICPTPGTQNPNLSGVSAWAGGGVIQRWKYYDQSGNGRDATQGTAASRPVFRNGVTVRGQQGLVDGYSATNTIGRRFLSIPVGHSVNRQVVSFGAMIVPGGAFDVQSIISLGQDNTHYLMLGYQKTTLNRLQVWGSTIFSSTLGPLGYQMQAIAVVSGASNIAIFAGGTKQTGTAMMATTLTNGEIAATQANATYFFLGTGYAYWASASVVADADVATINSALSTVFSATTSWTKQVVWDGDSLTNGSTNGVYANALVQQTDALLAQRTRFTDLAIDGQTMATIYANRAVAVAAFNGAFSKNLLLITGGTNDIGNAASGSIVGVGTDTWNNALLPYIQAVQAAGFTVIVGTLIARQWAGSATDQMQRETERVALNGLITSNAAGNGYTVADYTTASQLATWSGTYYVDSVHPNELGWGFGAPIASTAIAGVW